jgi:flagellar hook-basal body complex protein FliE
MTVNIANAVNAYANAGKIVGQPGLDAPTGDGKSFGDLLTKATNSVVDTVAQGEKASMQAVTGKADLASVTAAVNNAEMAVQTVVAIRDRVVQAYQDIMRMPI